MGNVQLSSIIARYFDIWIRQETWDSGHWSDRERFYRFVKAVKRYSRRPVSSDQIQTLMIDRWRHRRDSTVLEIKVEKYGEIYQILLEYERTPDFPDALIDCKNILAFYNRLRRSGWQNDQHIDKRMTAAWGKNWQRKLASEKDRQAYGSKNRNVVNQKIR